MAVVFRVTALHLAREQKRAPEVTHLRAQPQEKPVLVALRRPALQKRRFYLRPFCVKSAEAF
jgi:hypothetical protein